MAIYHNYRRSASECEEEIIFCAEDPERSSHYGPIHRIFDSSRARLDNGRALELAIAFYQDQYKNEDFEQEEIEEKIKECVYPGNIVESAGAWDDIEFINYLYDLNYFNDFDAIITHDGAVVFDYTLMEIVK